MTQLISLFTSQENVGQVVAALSGAAVEDKDIQVLEQLPNNEDGIVNAPIIATNPSMFGNTVRPVAAVPANPVEELPLSEDIIAFVRRSVADGSVLLLVEVTDKDLPKARTIIREHHGRILETAV